MSQDLLLKGWLLKRKSKSSILGSDGTNRRWFVLDKVRSALEFENKDNKDEYTLSYYKSPTSTQRCGWFFLADVRTILTDDVARWITIQLHSRTYQLRTPDHRQHEAWCHSLQSLCSYTSPQLFGRCNTAHSNPLNSISPSSLVQTQSLTAHHEKEMTICSKENEIQNQLEFLRALNKGDNSMSIDASMKNTESYRKEMQVDNYPKHNKPITCPFEYNQSITNVIDDGMEKKQEKEEDDFAAEPGFLLRRRSSLQAAKHLQDLNELGENNKRICCNPTVHRPLKDVLELDPPNPSESYQKDLITNTALNDTEPWKKIDMYSDEWEENTQCSFLPDDNFVNENWDSSSGGEDEYY